MNTAQILAAAVIGFGVISLVLLVAGLCIAASDADRLAQETLAPLPRFAPDVIDGLGDDLDDTDWTFPSRMDARNGHAPSVAYGARVGRPPAGPCDPFNEQRPAGRPGAA